MSKTKKLKQPKSLIGKVNAAKTKRNDKANAMQQPRAYVIFYVSS